MRQAIVVGLGEKTQPFLNRVISRLANAEGDRLRALFLTPAGEGTTARGYETLSLKLSVEEVQALYYAPHVRKWSAANWGKWGAALYDTRLYGKLAVSEHLEQIFNTLNQLDSDLSQKNTTTRRLSTPTPLDLYLVAHLSDPFASGGLLDCAYLLDHYAQHQRGTQRSIRVYGLLILPTPEGEENVQHSSMAQAHAVTFAALRELAFVQGGYSFFENHHPTAKFDIKQENHSPFESGGCFVVGGNRDERGGELSLETLHQQLLQWIALCSFAPLGDKIASRIHLRSRAVISTFGLQAIADPAQVEVEGTKTRVSQVRAQALAALRAMEGEETRLDDVQRNLLSSTVRPYIADRSELLRALSRNEEMVEGSDPFSAGDKAYRDKALRLRRIESDLRETLDDYHEDVLAEIWRALVGDAAGGNYKTPVFEDILRLGGGTLSERVAQCRVLFETAVEACERAQNRLHAAENAAKAAASLMRETKMSIAYVGYTRTKQGNWRAVRGQVGVWLILIVFMLLFIRFFDALGLITQIPVLLIVGSVSAWGLSMHQRVRTNEAHAAWKKAQDGFLNAQIELIAARIENESAQSLHDTLQTMFKIVPETARMGRDPQWLWRADILRNTRFIPLMQIFENESTPLSDSVDWSQHTKYLWEGLLSVSHAWDSPIMKDRLQMLVRGKMTRTNASSDRDGTSLRRVVKQASETAACVLHLAEHTMFISERTKVDELLGLPSDYNRFLHGTEESHFLRLDGREIPVFEHEDPINDQWSLLLIRLRPEVSLHAIFGIQQWQVEYQKLLEHDNYDGSKRIITRSQLHPTRVGVVSPDPSLITLPDQESLGGYPYSIAVIMLATLLRRDGKKALWQEWAEQFRVDVRSHNLDSLNFDELCGAMQEQPTEVQRIVDSLLRHVPTTLSKDEEADFERMLNVVPLVSETYADWEVWAVRQMRKAFLGTTKYEIEHRTWLNRLWIGLRARQTEPEVATDLSTNDAQQSNSTVSSSKRPARFENVEDTIKIGIWGTPQVGKTTYLLMLLRALERASVNWTIDPIDEASKYFWKHNQLRLERERRFPEKTVKTVDYGYWISYRNGSGPESLFQLTVTDTAGELYAEFFTESQRDKYIRVRQRLTESLESDKTPRQIFERLLECKGIIILIDPIANDTGGLPPGQMLRDLFNEIREAKGSDPSQMPYIALCLTKIDGEDSLWERKHQHPETSACQRTTGNCAHCMVYEQLKADFMTTALNRLFEPDYVRCFVVSSVGRKGANANGASGTINVSSYEKWSRPPTPLYTPTQRLQSLGEYSVLISRLNEYRANGIPMPPAVNTAGSTKRHFMPTMIDDYQALNPYDVEKPLAWLYEQITRREE
jgi:hypothetical protein